MAVTQIHAIETTLIKAIDYISNPDKTDNTLLISGYKCTPELAAYEFEITRNQKFKQGGNLAYHLIQSFSPNEVDYETAHEIGKQLADKFLKGKYEYVITTHTDREHVHNHIIFNSVPIEGEKKYRSTIPNYYKIREISDKLCLDYELSVVEPSGEKGKCYTEHNAEIKGVCWKSKLRETIDRSIEKARDWDEFLAMMKVEDCEIKYGKRIKFRLKGQDHFISIKRLGERYAEDNIKSQLAGIIEIPVTAPAPKISKAGISLLIDIENNVKIKQSAGLSHWAKVNNLKMAAMTINYLSDNKLLDYDSLTAKHDEIKGRHKTTLARIKDVEKRIRQLDTQIKDLDSYRKSKAVVSKVDTAKNKDKFRREHETDFILFNAAKQAVKIHFPSGKYPLIKELRAELKELYEEKNQLYPEYYEMKEELKSISTIKKNVDTILGQPSDRSSLEREREEQEKQKKQEKENDYDIHF